MLLLQRFLDGQIVLPAIKLKADRIEIITHSQTYDDKGSSFTIEVKNIKLNVLKNQQNL